MVWAAEHELTSLTVRWGWCGVVACVLVSSSVHAWAFDVEALRTTWHTSAGTVVRFEDKGPDELVGRIERPSHTAARQAFRVGDLLFHDVVLEGPTLRLRIERRPSRHDLRRICTPYLAVATATVPPERATMRFSTEHIQFVADWDAKTKPSNCRVRRLANPIHFELVPGEGVWPEPKVRISNLRVEGQFREAERRPVMLPSSEVLGDGRRVLNLPRAWVEDGLKLDLHIRKLVAGKWTPVKAFEKYPAALDRKKNWIEIDFEELIVDLYRADAGSYLVRAEVYRPGETELAYSYSTPPFTREEIIGGLVQRIDHEADVLFAATYEIWEKLYENDEDTARMLLWHGVHAHANHFSPEVTIENLATKDSGETAQLLLTFLPPDGELVHSTQLGLGFRKQNRDDILVVPGAKKRVSLARMFLDPQRIAVHRALRHHSGFELEVQPFTLAEPGGQTLTYHFEDKGPFANPCIALGRRMKGEIDAGLVRETQFAQYASAKERIVGRARGAARRHLQSCVDDRIARYKTFLRLHRALEHQLKAYEDTGLGKLDVAVRRHKNAGRRVEWGPRHTGETIYAPGGSSAWKIESYDLVNSSSRRGLAALGAALVPGLSYALDPDGPLFRSTLTGSATPRGSSAVGFRVLGYDRWFWVNGHSDLSDLHRDFLRNEALRTGFQDLLARGNGALPPDVARQVERKNFDGAIGEVHERLGHDRAMNDELKSVHARGAKDAIYLPGQRVAGPDLATGRGRQQLTDGIIIERIAGTDRFRLHHIGEAKAGFGSASGLASQLPKDAMRIKAHGLDLVALDTNQRRALGLSGADHRIPPDKLVVDFTDPKLFVTSTPRNVRPASELKVPRRTGGQTISAAERAAMEQAIRSNRRAEYSSHDLQKITQTVFTRRGRSAQSWNARNVGFEDFVLMTKRRPGGERISRDELVRRFGRGERLAPDGRWRPVFEAWERPVMAVDDSFQLWKKARSNPTRAQIDKAKKRALAGHRFNPNTNSWRNPFAKSSKMFVVDPRLPKGLASDAEFMMWWNAQRAKGNRADVQPIGRQSLRLSEAEVLAKRAKQGVYNPETKRFRKLDKAERLAVRLVDKGSSRVRAEYNRGALERMKRRIDANSGVDEFLQAAVAALQEHGRLGAERVHVTIEYDATKAHIEATLFVGPKAVNVPSEELERALVRHWYKYSTGLAGGGRVPAWVDE